MNLKPHIFICLIFSIYTDLKAQSPVVEASLDINNVRATILTHGDLFWKISSTSSGYEFPKGSGKHSNFSTSLWVSGYDQNTSDLHVAAQLYRQGGNDFWPGPIDSGNPIDSVTSNRWDKIWKIEKSDIIQFLTINPHTVFNTHPSILDWPAKGNPYATDRFGAPLTISKNLAPFVDVNQDGLYNALDGDYPNIKGEQALWWVFNDQKVHEESGGEKLNLEFKAMAYACNSIPALQNSTYYSFDITNYNSSAFLQSRISLFSSADLGYFYDDYIGVDTTRRLGYIYNGLSIDQGPNGYGANLTKHGLTILHAPQDSIGYKSKLGAFVFYEPSPIEVPLVAYSMNNLMHGLWTDFQPYTQTCNARDVGTTTPYVYTGNPLDTTQWSEYQCQNALQDRRFVLSTGDFNFLPGEEKNFTFAAINTPLAIHTYSITELQQVADSVIAYPNGCVSNVSTNIENVSKESFSLYPNPVNDRVVLKFEPNFKEDIKSISMFNTLGQLINCPFINTAYGMQFDVTALPTGQYYIIVQTHEDNYKTKFFKQ